MNTSWVNGEPILTIEEMRAALEEIIRDAAAQRFGVLPEDVTPAMIDKHLELEDEEAP